MADENQGAPPRIALFGATFVHTHSNGKSKFLRKVKLCVEVALPVSDEQYGVVPIKGSRFGVSEGLSTTFQLLAKTTNEAAVGVLLPALDSPHRRVREEALRTILKRRSPTGHREVLRRLHDLDTHDKEIIRENPGRMTATLRNAVLSTNRQTCSNACQAILWFHEYDLIAALITAAEDTSKPNATLAAQTILKLAELLYRETSRPKRRKGRDPRRIRNRVVTSLELSVNRFAQHKRKEILEAFLTLTTRENATLKRVLRDPYHPVYLAVVEVLKRSERTGIIRLLLSFLEDTKAETAAVGVLAHRTDRRFLRHLLRKIGYEPSAQAAQNLKRVESIAWLRDNLSLLDRFDGAAQHSAVVMALASGMKRLEVFEVIRYLAVNGHVEGRRTAVTSLTHYSGDQANQLVVQALDDADPQVQAIALTQLRQRGIPGAMSRTIASLDSPHEVVQQSARTSLSDFRFDRFLRSFEVLDDDSRVATGRLVLKVDPQSVPALAEEMKARSRTRRLRAIGISLAMGLVARFESQLIALLNDEDHMVRREAALALGIHESPTVRTALTDALDDQSVAVQEAVMESLRRLDLPAAVVADNPPNNAEETLL